MKPTIDPFGLTRDRHLEWVEEEDDEIAALTEPLDDLVEVVGAVQLLLFTAQHLRVHVPPTRKKKRVKLGPS
jgi:hypothetical protein